MIGRFGGEEFIVALPDTHPKEAQMVAERLQQKVSELAVMEAMPEHRLTVTIGIAGVLDEATDLDALRSRRSGIHPRHGRPGPVRRQARWQEPGRGESGGRGRGVMGRMQLPAPFKLHSSKTLSLLTDHQHPARQFSAE